MPITIKHKVSLVLNMIDNITGLEVGNEGIMFFLNESYKIKPVYKGSGLFVFSQLSNGEIHLTVQCYGYETIEIKAEIDDTKPHIEFTVFLNPNEYYNGSGNYKTIEGEHDGLESLEVVRIQREICNYKGIDERKRIMFIYGHRGKDFKQIPYAIIDESSMTYENFKIIRHIDDEQIKLEVMPEKTYKTGDKINRICPGKVLEGGKYVLKVADEGRERYIVKYKDKLGEHFTLFDFEKPETLTLSKEGC